MIFVTPRSPYVIHVTVAFLALVQVTAVSSPVAAESLPQLPLTFLDTTYAPPSTGQLITVNTGGDLQAALNQANSGDIIELEAGATFVGNFTLPTKPVAPVRTFSFVGTGTSLPGGLSSLLTLG